MHKYTFSFAILLFLSSYCIAQNDSLKLDFDLILGADRFYPNDQNDIYLPEYIRSQRALSSDLGLNFTEYTDIPQLHASVFMGLLTKFTLKEGYELNLDIFAEDRGQSFGSLGLDKVVLFPRIYGSIKDSTQLLQKDFIFSIKVGDLLAYQHNNGLTINNIDAQGINVRLDWNQWYFEHSLLGDLSLHVGLNIGEFYSYKFGRLIVKPKTSFDFNLSLNQYFISNPSEVRNYISFSNSISFANTKIFLDASHKLNSNFSNNVALLIGYEQKAKKNRGFEWDIEANYRFYSSHFNDDFLETSTRYRDLSRPIHNNTIGEFLYPLINTYRPFNQWSVYTEYQQQLLHVALFNTKMKQKILSKNLILFLSYEGMMIRPENAETAFYNFYRFSLNYKLPLGLNFELFTSNKLMNLDAHFQTFYQAKVPLIGFGFKRLQGYK